MGCLAWLWGTVFCIKQQIPAWFQDSLGQTRRAASGACSSRSMKQLLQNWRVQILGSKSCFFSLHNDCLSPCNRNPHRCLHCCHTCLLGHGLWADLTEAVSWAQEAMAGAGPRIVLDTWKETFSQPVLTFLIVFTVCTEVYIRSLWHILDMDARGQPLPCGCWELNLGSLCKSSQCS